jgi:hypothetical protein
MFDKVLGFMNKCSISIEIKWVEVMAIPLPYFIWFKISREYKDVLTVGMLVFIAASAWPLTPPP